MAFFKYIRFSPNWNFHRHDNSLVPRRHEQSPGSNPAWILTAGGATEFPANSFLAEPGNRSHSSHHLGLRRFAYSVHSLGAVRQHVAHRLTLVGNDASKSHFCREHGWP